AASGKRTPHRQKKCGNQKARHGAGKRHEEILLLLLTPKKGQNLGMRRFWLTLLLVFPAVGGCPSPAVPPVPPAEVPSLVTFPRTVGIDVSTIASSAGSSGLSALVGG